MLAIVNRANEKASTGHWALGLQPTVAGLNTHKTYLKLKQEHPVTIAVFRKKPCSVASIV